MKKYHIATGDWPLTPGYSYTIELLKDWGLQHTENDADYDLLVLPGGEDIGIHPTRDRIEIGWIEDSRRRGKKIFGICRGFQLLLHTTAVPLIQHIPDEYTLVEHRTLTGNWIGQSSWHTNESGLLVNTRHHQGAFFAEGWEIIDRSQDGLIEAACRNNEYGVQWHPEHPEMRGLPSLEWLRCELEKRDFI